jgi:hypothetical protein
MSIAAITKKNCGDKYACTEKSKEKVTSEEKRKNQAIPIRMYELN